MRELWEHKLGLAIALALAILATTRLLYGITVLPPGLEPKSLGVASASTHVIVDTPRSAVIDLRQDTYSLTGLTNRALLLGNVMASSPVREYIARRAGIPAAQIQTAPPVTVDQPRAIADPSNRPHTSDILKSPEEYRLSIQANPSVPVLDVYTEAPDAASAEKLANAAVGGLKGYLHAVEAAQHTPESDRVRLTQLGRARGGPINHGAGFVMAIIVFLAVFAAASAAVLFVVRARRGWASVEGLDVPPAPNST